MDFRSLSRRIRACSVLGIRKADVAYACDRCGREEVYTGGLPSHLLRHYPIVGRCGGSLVRRQQDDCRACGLGQCDEVVETPDGPLPICAGCVEKRVAEHHASSRDDVPKPRQRRANVESLCRIIAGDAAQRWERPRFASMSETPRDEVSLSAQRILLRWLEKRGSA